MKADCYSFGCFRLDLARMALLRDGVPVELRPKAFDTLRVLAENPGRVLSKDELVAAVWQDVIVNDDALAQCIRDIRKALGDDAQSLIETVPRRGYLFAGNASADAAPGEVKARIRVHKPGTGTIALVMLVCAAAILSAWRVGLWPFEPGPPFSRDPRVTIAVLPFETGGEAGEQAWLGEGLAEDVMTSLARFRDIAVIARNSSFRFAADGLEIDELREELGVDFALQGSVRLGNETLRLAVQLVDLRTGINRWAERYDRPVGELFSVRDTVADEIAARLAAETRDAVAVRVEGSPPATLEVYELVLRGRKAYRSFTREGAMEAEALTERALRLDPAYAVAWELLAQVLLQFFIQPYDDRRGDPATIVRARQAAERAVALDPGYSTGHATLGALLARSGDFDAGLAQLRQALELNPNDANTIGIYADTLSRAGDQSASLEAFAALSRLDPVGTPLADALRSRTHLLSGHIDEAYSDARACAAKAPHLQPCFVFLTIAASASGREDEAREAARKILEINPRFTVATHFRIITFRNSEDVERLASHLVAVGLPE